MGITLVIICAKLSSSKINASQCTICYWHCQCVQHGASML